MGGWGVRITGDLKEEEQEEDRVRWEGVQEQGRSQNCTAKCFKECFHMYPGICSNRYGKHAQKWLS